MGDLTPFHHQKIKETLSLFHSVTSDVTLCIINGQIQQLKSYLLLQKNHKKERDRICASIEKMTKEIWHDSKVFLFGSSINGLGFKGSDLDAFVEMADKKCKFFILYT